VAGVRDTNSLLIQNKETGASAFALSRDILLSPPGSKVPSSKLMFAREGDRYVLHQAIVVGDNHVHHLIHGTEIAELSRTPK
jgi:hypothetical protein